MQIILRPLILSAPSGSYHAAKLRKDIGTREETETRVIALEPKERKCKGWKNYVQHKKMRIYTAEMMMTGKYKP
jgi:hypothetical protein